MKPSVTGSHPAVIGVDFSGFSGRSPEAIQKAKYDLKKNVIETYNRGGVITAAWHFSNPVSKGGFNWVDSVSLPAVKYIIPGGEAHEKYKEILQGIGEWIITHYYAPHPGQVSVPDFMRFYNHPYSLFEHDLKKIYR